MTDCDIDAILAKPSFNMDYLFVCTPESYGITKQNGVIGYYDDLINQSGVAFKNAKVGEKIYFYVSGMKAVDAVAEITKGYFYDNKMIYGTDKDYVFPHRIEVRMLTSGIHVDFKSLANKLDLIKDKSGRVVYSAYLVRSFIPLNDRDAMTLRDACSAVPV